MVISIYAIPGIKRELVDVAKCDGEKIIQLISDYFGLPAEAVKGKGRLCDLVYARVFCYRMMMKQPKATLKKTASYFKRDHTTVIHNLQKLQWELDRNDDNHYIRDCKAIEAIFRN